MRDYAKVGGKRGQPAYRTPSTFRYQKAVKTKTIKVKNLSPQKSQIKIKKII
jgi:hypothetical protein